MLEKLATLSAQGKTILLVTHDLSEAKYFANRIVVMNQHQLILDFKADEMDEYTKALVEIELLEGEAI